MKSNMSQSLAVPHAEETLLLELHFCTACSQGEATLQHMTHSKCVLADCCNALYETTLEQTTHSKYKVAERCDAMCYTLHSVSCM